MRTRLQKLAERIEREVGPFGYRAFVDSAPVMEKALAEKAGLGWIGKHTNLLNRDRRLLVLPRRAVHRPAAAGRRAGRRALRHLQRLHRLLSDRGDRRPVPGRCAALHLLPDHRTEGAIPERCARCSATASTAATTASRCARGIVLPHRRRSRTSPPARAGRRQPCWSCSAGRRTSSCTHRGLGDPSHRLRALAAQHRGGARQCRS